MDNLIKLMSQSRHMIVARFLSAVLLVIGIVTAAMDKTFGGWSPIYWFLLSFAAILSAIWVALVELIVLLENKKGK